MPGARELEVSQLRRVAGGASRETWAFDATWKEGKARAGRGYILRRDPEASLLDTERDIEFRVYEAMQGSGVPVPEVYWLESDPQWLDRPFFVMRRLEGDASTGAVIANSEAGAIAQQKVEILARIHAFDWKSGGLEKLRAPSTAAGSPDVEIAHWEGIMREEALEPQPVLEMALAWLKANRPAPERLTVVHGDYRTGNLLVNGGKITGVLDWEMVHLGDPMEDVAWVCLRSWRWAGDARVGGLLSREEFYQGYEAASGTPIDRDAVHFWEVLGNLKVAVIFLTGARSFVEGRSKDAMHAFTAHLNADIEAETLRLISHQGGRS
ncbi:MAG: phosphotransferase family protein [Chloroflexi bacterium]|nr:phosphotransferase family protein [Chloroflexota bacterium]